MVLFTPMARAHPLDEFYQATFVTVGSHQIKLIVELYPGLLVAPQILSLIDTDQDETISETESQAYVNLFLDDVTFEIDGNPTPLRATDFEFDVMPALRAGAGVIRFNLQTDLPPDHEGAHQFFYRNNHQPDISVYLVSAISGDPAWVQIHRQERDVFQASLQADYTIKSNAPIADRVERAPIELDTPDRVSSGQKQLVAYLYDPNLSPLFMLVVLGLSMVLGGLHALTPGHGKTLVAAYLVGSRGTVKHAVFLGGVVTFTHTASVIGLGLLALLASQFIVPNILGPILEIMAGLLVVYLGTRLLWSRWRAYIPPFHPPLRGEQKGGHPHPPHHHDHNHEDHHHDDHPHHHHPIPERVRLSDLLTLGISGGLLPCPEALGIMLIAVGLNRILLGLGLVVAFSLGLAVVLIIIGILLVRMRRLLDQISPAGSRWQGLLPLLSALIVTLLGIGIVVKGLISYL